MRRRRRRSRVVIPLIIVVAAAGGGWWFWPRGDARPVAETGGPAADLPSGATAEAPAPEVPEAVVAAGLVAEESTDEVLTPIGSGGNAAPASAGGDSSDSGIPTEESARAPEDETGNKRTSPDAEESAERLSPNPRINASLQRYQSGQVLPARQELNRMLAISRDPDEQAELRHHLQKIADATVFSTQRVADDPLTETYTIQPNEYLITIGRKFGVPHEVIMMINGIEDPRRVRAQQSIKVPRGPFNVKIHTSEFRLDVYLQDLFVRSFPVGLGVDRGTPLGTWKVKERLPNPTYYPPTSAPVKRIIPPDDPANPLGERWIGLEGTAGDAVGREGYGIHGTIDPESIGKAVSLGCVRMHNRDVEFLYKLLLPGHSTVTTLP